MLRPEDQTTNPRTQLLGTKPAILTSPVVLLLIVLTAGATYVPTVGHFMPTMFAATPACGVSSSVGTSSDCNHPNVSEFSGASSKPFWSNLTAGTAPSERDGFSTTYDATDGYVLLFGGASLPGNRFLSDTWTFTHGLWTNITSTAGTPPAARVGYAMTYDRSSGYVVLAGGQSTGGTSPTDVWTFSAGRWSQLVSSSLPLPLQRSCGLHASFDTASNATVFLGSSCYGGPTGGTFYAFNAGNWTDLSINATTGKPVPTPGYEGAALADDPSLGGLVLFGGSDLYGNAYHETVLYAKGIWTDQTANYSGPPPAQVDAGMATYGTAYGILLYGGFQPGVSASRTPGETWWLNGTTWTNLTATVHPPTASYGGTLVWDSGDNASIWFAIGLNYTWSWGLRPPLDTVSILVVPSPAQVGQSVNFSSSHIGGTGPFTYRWSFGDGASSNLSNPSHIYSNVGVFIVNLTLSDQVAASAKATLSISVTSTNSSGIYSTPNPTDVGVPVGFKAQVGFMSGKLNYAWNFGDGSSSSSPTPAHVYQSKGVYLVVLEISASGGGSINTSATVQVSPAITAPIVSAIPRNPSLGQIVNFSARESNGSAPYTYSWTFGDGGTGGNLPTISHIFTTNGPFTTVVKIIDSAGQQAEGFLNISIALNLSITANWTAGAAPLAVGFASSIHGGRGGYVYHWTFGDGGSSGQASPAHLFAQPGSYQVVVAVTDIDNLQALATWFVFVAPGGGPLHVVLSAAPSSIPIEGFSLVTAAVSGGSGGYSYEWRANAANCSAVSILVDRCKGSTRGSFVVELGVADAVGDTATGRVTLVVGPLPSAPAPSWLSSYAIPVEAASIVGGAAVVGVALRLRGRFGASGDLRIANPQYRLAASGSAQDPQTGQEESGLSTPHVITPGSTEHEGPPVQLL